MTHAIWAEGLVKRFGETTALAGVDFAVRQGTVLGLLGPNGAGKTTAVRILTTLLRPDAGHARVGGYDVAAELQPGLRYDKVVEALGGGGELVEKAADLGPALRRAFDAGVPYLVNVLTDPADAYPRSSNLA